MENGRWKMEKKWTLMPELAIVSTLVLIAAPIVLVGATALAAVIKRRPKASS
jgi:hypothetical protein